MLNTDKDLFEFLTNAPKLFREGERIRKFQLRNGDFVHCVLWNMHFYITGTDIVKILIWRFQNAGRSLNSLKKFEEGVFSDLRNLKPGIDATLEGPRSEFLEFLYKNGCIRTQKKQKVFYWYSVPHDALFCDALERDLRRETNMYTYNKYMNSLARHNPAFNQNGPRQSAKKFPMEYDTRYSRSQESFNKLPLSRKTHLDSRHAFDSQNPLDMNLSLASRSSNDLRNIENLKNPFESSPLNNRLNESFQRQRPIYTHEEPSNHLNTSFSVKDQLFTDSTHKVYPEPDYLEDDLFSNDKQNKQVNPATIEKTTIPDSFFLNDYDFLRNGDTTGIETHDKRENNNINGNQRDQKNGFKRFSAFN